MFAEFERERMGERRSERAQADKARGWFGGGRTKYGFRAVKVDDHYEVEEDEDEKAVAYRMAKSILGGMSAARIARLPPRESRPSWVPLRKDLRPASRQVGGLNVVDILTDPDGSLDTDTWTKVQPVINGNAGRRSTLRRCDVVGVAVCDRCGAPMRINLPSEATHLPLLPLLES